MSQDRVEYLANATCNKCEFWHRDALCLKIQNAECRYKVAQSDDLSCGYFTPKSYSGPAPPKLLTPQQKPAIIEDKQRVFLMTLRQALIMLLGGLEDWLEMKRSIKKRKR